MEVGMQELADLLLFKLNKFNSNKNGSQLLLNLQVHSQSVLEPTVLMELTVLEPSAMELTDHSMDQPVPHAQEKSQMPSHTTTLNQRPDNHTKLQETSPQPTHPNLIHQPQSPLPSSKKSQPLVLTKKLLLKLEKISTTRDTHNQKRFSFLIQKLLELTLLSMLNTEIFAKKLCI
jgi:hypothetical protein